jgi:hypothetical protein
MLPDPNRLPASPFKSSSRFAITLSVSGEFWPPVLAICNGHDAVVRAGMPEASVYEDRDALPGKRNVRNDRTPAVNPNRVMNSKPGTRSVEQGT